MNPPYSGVKTWMRKLTEHGDGIALVFNRTDTAWFPAGLAEATVVCFVAGRIKFVSGHTGLTGARLAAVRRSSRLERPPPKHCCSQALATVCAPSIPKPRRCRSPRIRIVDFRRLLDEHLSPGLAGAGIGGARLRSSPWSSSRRQHWRTPEKWTWPRAHEDQPSRMAPPQDDGTPDDSPARRPKPASGAVFTSTPHGLA
jgi:hypothetical protein